MQSFMGLMQLVVMPMFFISGALFPVADLPGWLAFTVFALGMLMLGIAIWEFNAGE
jgi:ABC-2 type transport system permease protein